ncbi:MAG: hypothetical protein V7720_05950 [Halioglobus sp.]
MQITKLLAATTAALVLAGCKIEITVPEGGRVVSQSGNIEACESGATCSVDVVDIFFDETFVAEPADGMMFAGWEKVDRGLCGGNTDPCRLFTSGFEGNDTFMGFLENDQEIFFMNPTFAEDDGSGGGEVQSCEYTQSTPGGDFDVCLTTEDEGICSANGGALGSRDCTAGDPVGYCSTGDGDIYYYHGDAGLLEMGCNFTPGGEWNSL